MPASGWPPSCLTQGLGGGIAGRDSEVGEPEVTVARSALVGDGSGPGGGEWGERGRCDVLPVSGPGSVPSPSRPGLEGRVCGRSGWTCVPFPPSPFGHCVRGLPGGWGFSAPKLCGCAVQLLPLSELVDCLEDLHTRHRLTSKQSAFDWKGERQEKLHEKA